MKHCSHTEGPWHDCAYVDERNAKIPAAEKFATALYGAPALDATPTRVEAWKEDWNRAFAYAMDRIPAKQPPAGATQPPPTEIQ